MPSLLRYFCCFCDSADDKRSHSGRYEFSNRLRNNRRNKSGKNTWARRSLLDHDHVELNDFSSEQSHNQMKANEDSFHGRLQDHFTPKHRPTVQDVFENSSNDRSTSKTTFPWMDECFVPSSRNGTRLGISSVQLNAKRNEVAEHNAAKGTNKRSVKPNVFSPYAKSRSFTDGQERRIYRETPIINSSNLSKKYSNVHNGQVFRNEFNTAPIEGRNNRLPSGLGALQFYNDKPMVLRAPSSDVGVRKVSLNNSKIRMNNVPKLEDYAGKSSSSFVNTRPNLMDKIPSNNASDVTGSETETDVSFASEIIFRKQPSDNSRSEMSLKLSGGPGMFSANSNKYERLKPDRSNSDKSKSENPKTKGKYSKLSSDSMYGYVPKVVQNVHASNALEGTKIDDFFMQRMHERQLEDFGTFDKANDNCDRETVIITSLVESAENLNSTNETGNYSKINDMTVVNSTKQITNKDRDISKSYGNDNKSTKITAAQTDQNKYIGNITCKEIGVKNGNKVAVNGINENKVKGYENVSSRTPDGKLQETHKVTTYNEELKASSVNEILADSNNKKNTHAMHKTVRTGNILEKNETENDKYEDQVIMIDFPPNSETDKIAPLLTKSICSSGEYCSGASKGHATSESSNTANGEVLY